MRHAMTRGRMKWLACASVIAVAGIARADDVASARVARSRFTTSASADAIRAVACALDAHVDIAGQSRAIDLRISNHGTVTPCARPPANGFPLTAIVEDGSVAIEATLSDDFPPDYVREIETVVRGIAAEIERRIALVPPPAIEKKEAFSPALTVTGVTVAVLGIGMLVTAYGWLLGETANILVRPLDAGPAVLAIVGGGAFALGAIFVVVGERRVPVRTARVMPFIAPRIFAGLGATAGVTITF